MFRRSATWFIIVLILLAAITAYAGLSFVGSAQVNRGSVHGVVDVAGFGSDTEQVTVTMTVTGQNLTALCTNRGGNSAPGQNPVSVNASASDVVLPDHNGRGTADLSVNILPTWAVAGCPNDKWTVTDLLGTISVNFTGVDNSVSPPAVISQTLTCFVNEPAKTITCG